MDRVFRVIRSPSFVVVLALFLQTMFLVGTVKALGIFLDHLSISLNTTSTDVGVIFGLYMMFSFLPTPIFVAINEKTSRNVRRLMMLLGAASFPLGAILTAFASNNAQVALALSISGIGACAVKTFLELLLHELSDNFNLLLCLGLTGYGFGMVLPPLLAQALLDAYGWRAAMLLLGAMMANILPCILPVVMWTSQTVKKDAGMSHARVDSRTGLESEQLQISDKKPPGDHAEEGGYCRVSDHEDPASLKKETSDPLLPTSDGSMVSSEKSTGKCSHVSQRKHKSLSLIDKGETNTRNIKLAAENPSFAEKLMEEIRNHPSYSDPWSGFLYFSGSMAGYVYSAWHAFLIPHALQRGISPYQALIITLFAAAGHIGGRVGTGLLTQSLILPTTLFLVLTLTSIMTILCYAYINNIASMSVMSAVTGFCIASAPTLCILAGRSRFPGEKYPPVYVIIQIVFGLGSLIGGFTSGIVADQFSSFNAAFKLLAAIECLALLSMILFKIKSPRDNDDNSISK